MGIEQARKRAKELTHKGVTSAHVRDVMAMLEAYHECDHDWGYPHDDGSQRCRECPAIRTGANTVSNPTPIQAPDFKVDDWIICEEERTPVQITEKVLRNSAHAGWRLSDGEWETEARMRHATPEEMFRKGALVRWDDGDWCAQGFVDKADGGILGLQFPSCANKTIPRDWFYVDRAECTLVRPAPEKA